MSRNKIIEIDTGFDFDKELAEAKKSVEYYEEDLLISVATRIIEELDCQAVNRAQLAKKMNVSPAYITKILRGHANLSIESLAKVAFALDLKWECVLIPQDRNVGFYSLEDEDGLDQLCRVEKIVTKTDYTDSFTIDENDYEVAKVDYDQISA